MEWVNLVHVAERNPVQYIFATKYGKCITKAFDSLFWKLKPCLMTTNMFTTSLDWPHNGTGSVLLVIPCRQSSQTLW